jgi:antitoxin Phd
MSWTLAQAKDQLSEVVRRAVDQGPQTISVRGQETAVVLSKAAYEQLTDPEAPATLKDLLSQMDLEGVELTRDQSPARDIEL